MRKQTEKKQTVYCLISYGDISDLNMETTKKSVINRICKYLSKYGKNQSTTITVKTKNTFTVNPKQKPFNN